MKSKTSLIIAGVSITAGILGYIISTTLSVSAPPLQDQNSHFAALLAKQSSNNCELPAQPETFTTQGITSASSEAFRLCVSAFGSRQVTCSDPNGDMTRKYGQKTMIQKLNQELKNDTSANNAYIKKMATKYASSGPGGVGQWISHPDVGIMDCLETNPNMMQPVTQLDFKNEQCGYRCVYDNVARLGLEPGTSAGSMGSPVPDPDLLLPWWAHSAFEDFMAEKHRKITVADQDRYNPQYYNEYKARRQQNGLLKTYVSNKSQLNTTTTQTQPTSITTRSSTRTTTLIPTSKNTATDTSTTMVGSTPQRITDAITPRNGGTSIVIPDANGVQTTTDLIKQRELEKQRESKQNTSINTDQNIEYTYSIMMEEQKSLPTPSRVLKK